MGSQTLDLLVVGGGVVGACVARDAAMRGLVVGLVERDDFSHATSAASSKLIHGGLRYLKNFELRLVRESLRERRIWEAIAPHLVHPLPFVVPAYRRKGSAGRWMLRAGLTLYDLLAFDRNRLADEDKHLPAHRTMTRDEVIEMIPGLAPDELQGAVMYWDCQMHSPERLALEHIVDACEHGAMVANRAEVTAFRIERGEVRGAVVRDRLGGREVEIEARSVVNATGPWADALLAKVPGKGESGRIARSKGIHVITRPLAGDVAVAIESRGGHFFILPWRGHSLIGTTDVRFDGDPDDFAVTERDIAEFLETVNAGFPGAQLERGDVLHFYGGMRPLVESSPGEASYKQSRRAEIVDHGEQGGAKGLLSALGGKWTTARAVAEQTVDRVTRLLGSAHVPCRTHETPLPGGKIERFSEFVVQQQRANEALPADVVAHLARDYGRRMDEVVALSRQDEGLAERLHDDRPEIAAEVVHAVRNEMAQTLADVMLRRTGIATLGDPGDKVTQQVAELVAAERGWDAAEQTRQIEALRRRLEAPAP